MTDNIFKSWAESDDENGAPCESEINCSQKGIKTEFTSDSRDNSRSRKRLKHHSTSDSDSSKNSRKPRKQLEFETDVLILQRRQKQIDFGKNTVGYHNYTSQIEIDKRTKDDPKTPDKYSKYSRRSWDALIKMWRKKLHEYDTDEKKNDDDCVNSDED